MLIVNLLCYGYNRTNSAEHVGKTAIFRGEREAIFAGYLIRINVKRSIVDPEFLAIYLNSRKIREYGYSVMTSSVNQANISGSKLKEYPFLMPPLSEQRQIVSQLDSLSAETSVLESIYQQKLSNIEELKKSLLQQAFSGAL
uniref:restriction endonuclease subunit S n=1 Tax=Candidatus Electronema sp. TaxID=2698783 RepID=UPI00405732DC